MPPGQPIAYRRVLRHLLFWLVYILYQILQQSWENTDYLSFSLQPSLFINISVDILFVYINLYGLMPAFYYKRRYAEYAVSLIILLFADGISARLLTWLIGLSWDKIHRPAVYLLENKNFYIPVR